MAIKKIEIRPKGLDGTYADVLYPKTSTDMVEGLSTALSGKSDTSHTHTSSQVGLGSVPNYGVATQAEAQAGTSNAKFMTPLRVKEAITTLAPTPPIPIASQITIADAGNVFTATDVEGAMAELFQNVSDGKTTIATAITGKGVTASGSETHASLATKVGQIKVGKVANANTADVLVGKTFGSLDQLYTGTMPNNGNVHRNLTAQNQPFTIPYGFHSGGGIINATYLAGRAQARGTTMSNSSGVFDVTGLNFVPAIIAFEVQSVVGFGIIFDTKTVKGIQPLNGDMPGYYQNSSGNPVKLTTQYLSGGYAVYDLRCGWGTRGVDWVALGG